MNEYRVSIRGKFPSMNDFIAASRSPYGGNNMKRQSQKIIKEHLKAQIGSEYINRPIKLHYHFYEPNKKRDKDNISGYFHKVFQDSLVELGIIKDDKWDYIIGYRDDFDIDRNCPRIEIRIKWEE